MRSPLLRSRPVVSIVLSLAGHPKPANPCGAGRHNEELDVDLTRLDAMRNDIADADIECIQSLYRQSPSGCIHEPPQESESYAENNE
jgi:hypothetical protein